MKSAKDIEQSIKKLDVESGDRIHDRILERLLIRLDKSKKQGTVEKTNVWRKIMRSKVSKIAAAAMIAILVGWTFLFSPLTSSNQAWAKMLETMKEMNWIYFDIVFDAPPEVTEEMIQSFEEGLPLWISFNPEVQITKKTNGEIIYTDCDQGVRYHYSPDSNTVTIDSHASKYNPSNPQSPFEIIEYYTEMFQESSLSIQSEFRVQDGREVEIIHLSHNEINVTGVRDVDRNLLVKVSIETNIPPGSEFVAKTEVSLSYPDKGPADIFAAGAPAGAQVVDRRPEGDANEIMQTIQQHYDHNYGNRVCVLLYSRKLAGSKMGPRWMVVSRKQQNLYRADTYNAENIGFIAVNQPTLTIYEQIKDVWPHISIEEAFRLENSHCVRSQDLYDGKYALLLKGGPPAKSLKTGLHYPANGPTLALEQDLNSRAWVNPYDLGVNNSRIAETVTRLPENPRYQGLTGLKVSHELHQKGRQQKNMFQMIYELWIDPQKDHMVIHRTKWQHQYLGGRIVQTFVSEAHILETSRTSDGQWYPAHVESKMHYSDDLNANDEINDIVIQIDTDWKSSEAIFDKDYIIGAQ
jgi:hypothetical protein